MKITEIPVPDYEKVVVCKDEASGLHAIIAVHNTTLGPALGGMRMLPYASEAEAMTDVLRLSRGMSYKSAVAETGLGGGKSVIIGDPNTLKSEALFLAMGRFVNSLGGLYITAEDMNISIPDLEIVGRETKYVTGLSRASGSSGNPSPYTAHGCLVGIQASAEEAFGTADLTGKRVVLQGVGAVGGRLAVLLKEQGAEVTVCDINQERAETLAKEHGFQVVADKDHLDVECDIYAPCARGAGINDQTIPRLKCKVIAGCANNVLAGRGGATASTEGPRHRARRQYVIGGGIISVSSRSAAWHATTSSRSRLCINPHPASPSGLPESPAGWKTSDRQRPRTAAGGERLEASRKSVSGDDKPQTRGQAGWFGAGPNRTA
ncbi:MAG: Glu/Leu/Phe/Val dehydrogenase dimerization domain-containing protein [Planctomycetota bacterium]